MQTPTPRAQNYFIIYVTHLFISKDILQFTNFDLSPTVADVGATTRKTDIFLAKMGCFQVGEGVDPNRATFPKRVILISFFL